MPQPLGMIARVNHQTATLSMGVKEQHSPSWGCYGDCTGRNPCSIVSGYIQNCSYGLLFLLCAKTECSVDRQRHENCGHNEDRLCQNGEKATSQNVDNESKYFHGVNNVT